MKETSKRRSPITAGELMDKLENDPGYQRRIQEKHAEQTKRVAELASKLQPVDKSLEAIGYNLRLLSILRGSRKKYDSAIPILLEYLQQISSADAKLVIVSALAVPWAGSNVGPVLVREFEKAPKEQEHLRWTIANALEAVAQPSLLEKIIEIATNKENGKAREMVVLALGKFRDPRSVSVLIKLLNDDQVAGHAIKALGKLKAKEALDHLAKFTDHPQWVRSEAEKAIARIMKAHPPNL